jgi:mRNA-degrading endonuclease RelE of RelBE toxin-antitoxin system
MKPTIYYRTSYLEAFTQLPGSIQKKAHKALKIFEREPTSNGLNYEKLEGGKDQKIFSIRVDGGYRIILARAPEEPIYMACWVGNHDDSYNWAKNRILTVHPLSGEIQIIETIETAAPVAESPKSTSESPGFEAPDIFVAFTDADLRQLGATDDTLRLIRSITDDHGLEKLERCFTAPVFDALLRLACGDPYDVVLDELGIETGKQYATDDFKTALELDVNKQRFAVITDDSELERILSEPLAHWRVFLHPSQRKLVDANFNGPARVLGGAGTGKTVVAMHRAKYLASRAGSLHDLHQVAHPRHQTQPSENLHL